MKRPHPDLANASDELKQISLVTQIPIRGTTQIWVVKHHQYVISVLLPQMSFCWKPVVALQNVGCFLRLCKNLFFMNLSSLHTSTDKLYPWELENNQIFFTFSFKSQQSHIYLETNLLTRPQHFIVTTINYAKSTFLNNHCH